MRREYFIAWVGLVCLLGSVPVWAEDAKTSVMVSAASAVPRLVRFSGVVKEVAGKPLQGAVEVSFSLYEDQEGGSAIWGERQAVEADAQGRYAVLLGATQAEGLPAEIFASGKARWLEVEVQGLSPQPRVLLVSVPYAMKAEDAERLGGKKASDFVLAEQLKEEVKTAVSLQVVPVEKGVAAKEAALTAPTSDAPAITSGQSSFACGTTTPCVTVSQSSTGSGIQAAAKTLGLYGVATQTTGTTYGIQGRSASTTGRGILGYATATTGGTLGVYGLVPSTSGVGLYGEATATTGATRGLYARAASTSGVGVWGDATAASGATRGVFGRTYSPSSIAVYGQAAATTGSPIGVYGQALSPAGIGVVGYGSATTGATTGVLAKVFSPDGIALIADNTTAGQIFSGRYNGYENIGMWGDGYLYGSFSSFLSGYFWNGVYGDGYHGFDGSTDYDDGAGVYGYASGYGDGVFGESLNSTGVHGSGATNGVYGYSQDNTGVYGDSSNGWGVYGYSENGAGLGAYGYLDGVDGWGDTGAGVYGGSPVYGVYGYSESSGGGIAVYAQGDFVATGAKSAVVPLTENRVVALYAMESPENWFEDFGSGQMQNGAAAISIDPTFVQTVNTESGYHVFLTPNGNCEGLYVASKGASAFEVRELRGGKSDVAFDYRIVARRRGYETVRLRQVEADAEVVTKLREKMAAASSANPHKLVFHKEMERPKKPVPPKRATRPARPTRMFPRSLNAPRLMNAPPGLNLRAPSN